MEQGKLEEFLLKYANNLSSKYSNFMSDLPMYNYMDVSIPFSVHTVVFCDMIF